MMSEDSLPLVTVCVVSYNAESFILQTLESIYNQTYAKIEIIISDDASTDETISLCSHWLENHQNRFVGSSILTVEKNTGVTANSNRGLKASHGKWWKIIGSDDILHPECIEKFVTYVEAHPEIEFIFGKQIKFSGEYAEGNFTPEELPFRALFFRDAVSAKKQYNIIVKLAQVGCAPSSFAKTELLRRVGGFNMRFPMNEDTPLYIQLTKLGIKLWYLDEFVVYRRVHQNSIMHQKDTDDSIIRKAGLRIILGDWAPFIQENSNWLWKRMSKFSQWMSLNIIRSGNTKKSWRCRFWFRCSKCLNPYRWYVLWARIKDKILNILGY